MSIKKLRIFSLEGKLVLISGAVLIVASILTSITAEFFQRSIGVWWLGPALVLLIAFPILVYLLDRIIAPTNRLLQALTDMVARLKDDDFSVSLVENRNDELGDLVRAHNQLGNILRSERQSVFQRELLLDTVFQSTSQALLLADANGVVIYSNAAARQLFNRGKPMDGSRFGDLLDQVDPAFGDAIAGDQDGLFTVTSDAVAGGGVAGAEVAGGEAQTFHLSFSRFTLNTRPHRLYLFKRLTQELNRQEVETWKKVIRVISHELNNSLAPISSLAHSGKIVVEGVDDERLMRIFLAIEERSDHLKGFVEGYARFARLPAPIVEQVDWSRFIDHLRAAIPFELTGKLPETSGLFDPTQIEQVLINLLKNAREAGADAGSIELAIESGLHHLHVSVKDRGTGMSEQVAEKSLLPFYSTKQTGTGLGLPLCREIVEAHGGRLSLANRDGGGLVVEIVLPQ